MASYPVELSGTVPLPGLLWGPYPERTDANELETPRRAGAPRADAAQRLAAVRAAIGALRGRDEAALDAQRQHVQRRLAREGLQPQPLERAVAVAAEAAHRTLGLAAYDGQLLAALYMLDEQLVEMATGEGKSLATALAAAAAALSGMPVHVLTANDYLVRRDADRFAPLYRRLGLDVAAVVAGMDAGERRQAYARPVVVVTAKELVFDYLRDRSLGATAQSALRQRAAALGMRGDAAPLLRGLCMALVDEADSVLVDEAQMPLILSRERDDAAGRAYLWQGWTLSAQLVEGHDFRLQPARRQAQLTVAGREHVAGLVDPLTAVWQSRRHREHAIATALAARYLYVRDRDYVVQQLPDERGGLVSRIAIVDDVTGRLAEGRRWSHGLHAMVALKEDCRLEPEMETLAQITYQRFFRRFHRLGGLSGTLSETRGELRQLYGLAVAPVATRLPCRRRMDRWRLFADAEARWAAVCRRCSELSAQGRPVLVGTDSVADSRALSAVLHAAGLPHAVLDARHDADEAAVVARAGDAGRITVATRMAGRGTDIAPDARALRAGGLHVLCCQLNPSRRLDRQLVGRAARQGQPGSAETWIALDAPRFRQDRAGRWVAAALRLVQRHDGTPAAQRWLRGWHAALQRWDEIRQAHRRAANFRQDGQADRSLTFTDIP